MDLGEALVSAYPKLLRFAQSWVRNTADAEDFVMQAVERILENAKSNEISNVEAYAITVVKNLIRDSARKQKPIYGDPPDVADLTDPGGLLAMRDILSGMREDCQKVIEFFGLGYSYTEIAEMLGIAEGTVASRKARCTKEFKREWEGAHG